MLAKSILHKAAVAVALVSTAYAAEPNVTSALQWRLIGPFRGGWSTIALGVADRPNTAVHVDDAAHMPLHAV